MALLATLKFGSNDSGRYNREYPVLSVRGHYSRHNNGAGPDEPAKCESLTLTLPTPRRSDTELYDWFINNSKLSGCIVINQSSLSDSDSVRTIKFEDAQCVFIGEEYTVDSGKRLCMSIEMTARMVTVDEVEFNRL